MRITCLARSAVLGASMTAAVTAGSGTAAAWPDKPIRFVVPFTAGGPVDVVARLVAAPVAESLGATILIENRGGAGGNIGTAAVARAEPDGATFLVTSGSFVVNPSLYDKVPYDPVKDFEPVVEIAVSPNLFVATTASEIGSLADLVAAAKREPGKLAYAGPGLGTQSHLAGELLKVKAGIDIAHVSHNGAGPAVHSMLSGAVQIGVLGLAPVQQQLNAGTFKALAMSSARRWRELPDVPTMLDLGYKDFVIEITVAMYAPARTPAAIVERMAREAIAGLQKPETRSRLLGGGFDITGLPPAELKAKTAHELKFWGETVAVTGIRMK